MYNDLRKLQRNYDAAQRGPEVLQQRLITACALVPVTHLACFTIVDNVYSLVANIKQSLELASIASASATTSPTYVANTSSTMFTDRNFNSKRSHNDHSHGHNPRKKRCFCCGKEGCWSNRHTQEERDKAY